MASGKQIAALCMSSALALGLVACGGSSGGSASSSAASTPLEAQQEQAAYEGREARELADLAGSTENAIGWAKDILEEHANEQQEWDPDVDEAFDSANRLYYKGDFQKAAEAYEDILVNHPLHFGANVNLVLTHLRQGENEGGLVLAMRTVYLFPTEAGCLLNAQAAGAACGYSDSDIEAQLNRVLSEANGTSVSECLSNSNDKLKDGASYFDFYGYNSAWNRADTLLYDALHGKDKAKTEAKEQYGELRDSLALTVENHPDDKDVGYLLAFMDAAGEQLEDK